MPITDIAEDREPVQADEQFTIDRFQDVIRELLGQPAAWDDATAAAETAVSR